jgi:hypothetical protein
MSETLIDRVVSIKQAVASQLPHGASLSEAQQAEILIAQVKAIIADPTPIPIPPEPEANL